MLIKETSETAWDALLIQHAVSIPNKKIRLRVSDTLTVPIFLSLSSTIC